MLWDLVMGSHWKDIKLYALDPFHLGQQAFKSINKSIIQQFRIHSTPKKNICWYNSESTENLNIYLYNYQTETAIFLATKHEKTVMACSYLFFKYFLHFKLLTSNHALEIYVLNIEENYLTRQLSWKFTYTLRKTILLKMCKKFC